MLALGMEWHGTMSTATLAIPSTVDQQRIVQAFRLNKYIPHFPTAKQSYALLLPHLEVFFGGSGGGGKSDWLLMSALQHVNTPGYSAILFRRTFTELSKPEALMDRAHGWLRLHKDARWSGMEHAYKFPSGAQIVFSHLENESSIYEHQSAAYQFIGFDELTTFTERMYTFLFSRLRRLKGSPIPLRMRSASNPGGPGHQWVKQRFIVQSNQSRRPFVPARIVDNPFIDSAAYERSLAELDPVTRQQIKDGDWDIIAEGNMFKRSWFPIVHDWPRNAHLVRSWDLAGTEARRHADPDWTVGLLLGELGGRYWIIDIVRERLSPKDVEDLVRQTAEVDGRRVDIVMEQEGGASGKTVIQDYATRVLRGFTFKGQPSTGSKVVRARPASSACGAKNIMLLEAPWNGPFLEEAGLFHNPKIHDDQIDALSAAVNYLAKYKPLKVW